MFGHRRFEKSETRRKLQRWSLDWRTLTRETMANSTMPPGLQRFWGCPSCFTYDHGNRFHPMRGDYCELCSDQGNKVLMVLLGTNPDGTVFLTQP